MDKQRRIDISVGLLMLFGLCSLLFLVLKVSGFSTSSLGKSYEVKADFVNIGGLKVHAPVTVAGVRIGEVSKINLQPNQLNATVTLKLRSDVSLPYDDISARILTEGLLGSNYVSIVPGFDSSESTHPYLAQGDVIAKTQEAMVLENLIGQLLFSINK